MGGVLAAATFSAQTTSTTCSNRSAVIGLVTWPSAPALAEASACSRHGVGGQGVDRRAPARAGARGRRMARMAVSPSITGICMSIRIRSKSAAGASSTASAPFSDGDQLDPGRAEDQFDDPAVGRMVLGQQHAHRVQLGLFHAPRLMLAPHLHRAVTARQFSSSTKAAPRPGVALALSSPSMASASEREIARPRPVPPYCRVIEPSACSKRPNRRCGSPRRNRCRCRTRSKVRWVVVSSRWAATGRLHLALGR